MHILIVEDESSIRKGISLFLKTNGYDISEAKNGKQALDVIASKKIDLVISDVKMPEMTGQELLAELARRKSKPPILMMTAYANVKDAVTALQNGAEDYLIKPLDLDELAMKIKRIKAQIAMRTENRNLKQKLERYEFPDMIGSSRSLLKTQELILQVARDADLPVMILGESGTGKELAARMIHKNSPRFEETFIGINCAAFGDELLESELFGHKKGSFTGAMSDKTGIFKAADKGTLFLDEVSEMSSRMQAKLLRVLQEKVIQPVGSTETQPVDVRILGASNKNLHQLVQQDKFRQDLFYRLNVVEVTLPPLFQRAEDIPLLIQHFLHRYGGAPLHLAPDVLRFFAGYRWPGNVRELENVVRMLLATHPDGQAELNDLPSTMLAAATPSFEAFQPTSSSDFKLAFEAAVDKFERSFFAFHLQNNKGNVSKTAEAIGLSRTALHQKINKYGLKV